VVFISDSPGYVANSFFAASMLSYKDLSDYSAGSLAPNISPPFVECYPGTYYVTFGLGSNGTGAINSVTGIYDSLGGTDNLTFIGQTGTSGAFRDSFTFLFKSYGSPGYYIFPEEEETLTAVFGSNWTSGQYFCYSASIVKVA